MDELASKLRLLTADDWYRVTARNITDAGGIAIIEIELNYNRRRTIGKVWRFSFEDDSIDSDR